jgi:hypothetical protein
VWKTLRGRLTRSRLVDILLRMPPRKKTSRQIVGFSLPPELAGKVKVEAARRQLSLKKLFEEMWGLYQQSRKSAR